MAKSTKMRARTIKQNMKHGFFLFVFLEVAMPLFECQGRFFLLVNNVLNQLSLIFDKRRSITILVSFTALSLFVLFYLAFEIAILSVLFLHSY